jgi:hypothetical protein
VQLQISKDGSSLFLRKGEHHWVIFLFQPKSKHAMKILDASEPEFGGPMTEDEVRDFLANSKKMFTFLL